MLVESEPEPLPPKSVLELEASANWVVFATGEVTAALFASSRGTVEVELEPVTLLLDGVEASIAPDAAFLGETTLATRIWLCPTLSSVISSKSKLGKRCGDSILACPSWILGGGVRGRSTLVLPAVSLPLITGLGCDLGESVLSSSECALDPDSEAGERGVATLALCEKKGEVKPMGGRENRDFSLAVGCGCKLAFYSLAEDNPGA